MVPILVQSNKPHESDATAAKFKFKNISYCTYLLNSVSVQR